MLARSVVPALLMASLAMSCTETDAPVAQVGDPCMTAADCGAVLECQHEVCVDDRGPAVRIVLPEPLTIFDTQPSMLTVVVQTETEAPDDRVVISLDGDGPAASFDALDPMLETGHAFQLSQPLASGPHHVNASVEHADGSAYLNPSARTSTPLFVLDAAIPDAPMAVIMWPPAGYRHLVGTDLEVEVAVLPGSFTFSAEGGDCLPLDGCTPAFAPECEDDCGPVSRDGHVKLFLRDGFPDCLQLEFPDACGYQYVALLRPGSDDTEVLDGYRIRGTIAAALLTEPGPVPLTAMLSYGYHVPYPNEAEAVHDTIMIELVE